MGEKVKERTWARKKESGRGREKDREAVEEKERD